MDAKHSVEKHTTKTADRPTPTVAVASQALDGAQANLAAASVLRTGVRFVCDPDDHTHVAVSSDGVLRCWFVGHLSERASVDPAGRDLCRGNPAEVVLRRYEQEGVAALTFATC